MVFILLFFFFNDTATTEIYTLSLHDALPISGDPAARRVDSAIREGVAGDGRDGGGVAVQREPRSDGGQRGRAQAFVRTSLGRSGVAGPLHRWSDLRGASRPGCRGRGRGRLQARAGPGGRGQREPSGGNGSVGRPGAAGIETRSQVPVCDRRLESLAGGD